MNIGKEIKEVEVIPADIPLEREVPTRTPERQPAERREREKEDA